MFSIRQLAVSSRLLRAGCARRERIGRRPALAGPPPGVTPRAEAQCSNAPPHPSSSPVKFL